MFRSSRLRLTFTYSLITFIVIIVLIVSVRWTLEKSLFSEQKNELFRAADSVAEAQAYQNQHPNAAIDENRYYMNTNDRIFFYVFDSHKNLLYFMRAPFRIEGTVLYKIDSGELKNGETETLRNYSENGSTMRVMILYRRILIGDEELLVYTGKDVTAMYSGLRKATYALIIIGILALAVTTGIGYVMAGRAIIPLKEAYDRQKQFAADASHELRTPLSVVMSSADLLLADPTIRDPFLREIIGDLKDEVKKMSKLVSDLLMVARSDNNALKLKIQKLDLGELLEQNVRMMTPLAEKKGVILSGRNLRRATISGDEEKIKQLILILVDNAVKYTESGGHVLVQLEYADEDSAVFSVQDSGIGIAPEDQEKIFERFYRVDKARSREMGGNGLGLAIALEILRLHGGKISVESQPNVGTKFTVELKTQVRARNAT
ncbi:MAG: sensor histidine kinase [Selenomonadaceae bacterium]|nr:sensor histidine kinase [Selenomonadaceae bacterium]